MHWPSRRGIVAALATLPLVPRQALSQTQTAIRLIYPSSAGGAGDSVARLLADRLRAPSGRPVIVENRTGAGGRIGVKAVVDAVPDGATLLFVTGTLISLHPLTERDLGYDPQSDLQPLSQIMQTDLALCIAPDVPARSLAELTAWLRANPGSAAYGSPGIGTSSHFMVSEYGRLQGLELRHVPYRGSSVALPDVTAGRLPLYAAATPELIEHHRAGTLRIIATSGEMRSKLLPDLATFKEAGVDVAIPFWFGLYAPAKVPVDIASRLAAATVATMKLPDVRRRVTEIGFEPIGTGSEELRRVQVADLKSWSAIIKASGFVPGQW